MPILNPYYEYVVVEDNGVAIKISKWGHDETNKNSGDSQPLKNIPSTHNPIVFGNATVICELHHEKRMRVFRSIMSTILFTYLNNG